MSTTLNPYEHRRSEADRVPPRTAAEVVRSIQHSVEKDSLAQSPLPYPDQDAQAEVNVGPWRDGKNLVIQRGSPMPDRCIKTNAPAEGYLKKLTLVNDTPGSPHRRQALGLGLLAAGVLATGGKTTGMRSVHQASHEETVHLGLSSAYRRRRRNANIAGAVGMFICFAYTYMVNQPIGAASVDLWGFGALLIVAGITTHLSFLVKIKRVDGDYIWLRGASRAFLETLPPWPG